MKSMDRFDELNGIPLDLILMKIIKMEIKCGRYAHLSDYEKKIKIKEGEIDVSRPSENNKRE